ncbi:uncharacterized protein EV154DRAFT_478957 [Mucor mucedo]|uniref:uncharacterized protein n=1 Tax=Mucor mucedo TaxID=29922 RepID=UPI00222070B6|nr:uncharacterized protein EV154DRAFT_478957 [Mucor mucedo]KAI7893910.1 hypothetical protein EV154DRAFT_478957 [Mucor mucedo]
MPVIWKKQNSSLRYSDGWEVPIFINENTYNGCLNGLNVSGHFHSFMSFYSNMSKEKRVIEEDIICNCCGRAFNTPTVFPKMTASMIFQRTGIPRGSTRPENKTGYVIRVPDLSLCAKVGDFQHAIFIAEVKSVQFIRSENSPPDPDSIKLVNEMKDELDSIMDTIDKEHRIVYSLLVQGSPRN